MRYSASSGCKVLIILIMLTANSGCSSRSEDGAREAGRDSSELIIKKRDDGTISSVNQVDEMGIVHGLRITFYEDGETVYSKTTLNHGIKVGPAERYYRNGQVFEHTSYVDGQRHGTTRKYYMNGDLMAEFKYDHGYVLPGLKEYNRDGTVVTDYPGIGFRERDQLAGRSRIELQLYCEKEGLGVKYYRVVEENGEQGRVYLISEKGSATLQFYVRPGESLDEKIEIIAEIPTALGNIMVKNYTYQLSASNLLDRMED